MGALCKERTPFCGIKDFKLPHRTCYCQLTVPFCSWCACRPIWGGLMPPLDRLKGISQVPKFLNSQGGSPNRLDRDIPLAACGGFISPRMKGLTSRPPMAQSVPQQQTEVGQRVRGHVPAGWGRDSSGQRMTVALLPCCLKERAPQGICCPDYLYLI